MPNTQEIIQKAGAIIDQRIRAANYCTLTGIDSDGCPASTTISISKHDGIRWLTLCTGVGAPSSVRFRANPKACLCLNLDGDHMYHIALMGEVQVYTDLETKREMWYDGLADHFSGPEDDNFAVLRFTTKSYSLWVDYTEVKGSL